MDSHQFELPLSLELLIARASVDPQLRASLLANPLQSLGEHQIDSSALPELIFHDGVEMSIVTKANVVHVTLPALSSPSIELKRDESGSREFVTSATNSTYQTQDVATTTTEAAEAETTTVAAAEVAEATAVATTEAEATETTTTAALETEVVLVVVAI